MRPTPRPNPNPSSFMNFRAMTECPYQSTAKSGTSSSKKKPMTNRDWWPDSLNLNVLHQDRKLGELALFFFMHIMCHHLKSYSLTSGIQYSNLCTSITRAPSIHHILISQPIFFSFVCIIRCQI